MPDFDVVVLGAGLAGYCASLSAAESGASVLLVEKCPQRGGSTVLSGGFMAFARTPLQHQHGIQDSPELLLQDLHDIGGPYVAKELLQTYVAEQASLYEWLAAKGLRFETLELSAGQSAPRSHGIDPGGMIETLHARAEATGRIAFRTGTAAVSLTRSGHDGRVTGVTVEESGRLEDIVAHRGVVIATGGFSRSEEFLRNFAPRQAAALRVGGEGNAGDGLRMAWRLGASLRDMGEVKGTYGAHVTHCNNGQELLLIFYRGAIMINRAGKRFVDESLSYKILGDACLAQDGAVSWQVFDGQIFDDARDAARLFNPQPALHRGLLVRADTLDALAQKCGIDPAGLAETVAGYNADCATGTDKSFGRDGLCHHVGALVPIARPPFYAYPSTTAVLATYCGLAIDASARVIDVYDEPIAGLYAAGEVTGGFHGRAYMTGSSLGKSALFGRVAGRSAASDMTGQNR